MSEREYKEKTENMFARNTVLINELDQLKARIEKMKCCQNCKYEDMKISDEPCRNCKHCSFSDSEIVKWESEE